MAKLRRPALALLLAGGVPLGLSAASPSAFLIPGSTARNSSAATAALFAATVGEAGNCALYGCSSGCGSCFNAGARPGVKCKGAHGETGYLCPSDIRPGSGGDMAYACMDWTFGSAAMLAAEGSFRERAGQDVYFGVGTYGIATDPQQGLGACFRLKVQGMDKDIIAQSINTGFDVAGNQFDLQMGAGGTGAYNTCSGGEDSMFPGLKSVWGCQYGGIDNRAACSALPPYPQDGNAMRAAGDSLVSLCETSFDRNVRLSGAGESAGKCKYNPTVLDVARVQCPIELVQLTQMQRSDDPAVHKITAALRPAGFPNHDKTCLSHDPAANDWDPKKISAYCLTRMMDCRKPSGGWSSNVRASLMVPGKQLVQTCTSDGYTRIDVRCGCGACQC